MRNSNYKHNNYNKHNENIKAIFEEYDMAFLIRHIFNVKGYKLFTNGSLNHVFIRNNKVRSNNYDDVELQIRVINNRFVVNAFSITTDPGEYYLLNGLSKGTAILAPQQVIGMFKRGKHKGRDALVQNKKVLVIRDFNKDVYLDWDVPEYDYKKVYDIKNRVYGGTITRTDYYDDNDKLVYRTEYGMFGINNHDSKPYGITLKVNKYSAGCPAHENATPYKEVFISDIDEDCENYGETFTGTIITIDDLYNAIKFIKNNRVGNREENNSIL